MIQFDFGLEAKTALKVWPDNCDVCHSRVPVTHIVTVNRVTKRSELEKICARCAVAYVTDSAFDLFEADHVAHIEFDAVAEEL